MFSLFARRMRACHIRNIFVVLAVVGALVASLAAVAGSQSAKAQVGASAAANLDQCRNGGVGPPLDLQPCLNGTLGTKTYSNYVNGNAGPENSHWKEGQFVPYRTVMTGLSQGDHTLVFTYDTVVSNKHALDYLGSYDATEKSSTTVGSQNYNNNNPCYDVLGTDGCTAPGTPPSPTDTIPVPTADLSPGATCNAPSLGSPPTQDPGEFSLFAPGGAGATLTDAHYVSQGTTGSVVLGSGVQAAACTTTVSVTFHLAAPAPTAPPGGWTAILAWGGHIASAIDWGVGNSASAINGSPYHMFLESLDNNPTGGQDRSLKASAVAPPPTVSTQVDSTTISTAGKVTDTATLTGPYGTVTGTVDFKLCSNTTTGCPQSATGPITTVTLSGGKATATFGPNLAAGNYCIGVTYKNDDDSFYSDTYYGAPAGECFTVVEQKVPTITTTVTPTSISAGDTVTDTATFSPSDVTGTVDFYLCSDTTTGCPKASASLIQSGVAISGGSATSDPFGSTQPAGNYCVGVQYSGDSTYSATYSGDATGECFTIGNTPSISTKLVPSQITVGSQAHDTATLTNASSDATGTVQYRWYENLSDCEADTSAWPTTPSGGHAVNTVNVDAAGSVPDSSNVTFSAAGTYYWAAFYLNGNTQNSPAASDCRTEILTVNQAKPSITTKLSDGTIQVGGSVQDTATLDGATSDASGTVSYQYYENQTTCTTDTSNWSGAETLHGTNAGNRTLSGGGQPGPSDTVTFNTAGTYYWAAFYTGDGNNNAAASDCTKEVVTVTKATPSITTKLSAGTIPAGGSVQDTATLSGATSGASGTVYYQYYDNQTTCTKDTSSWTGTGPLNGTNAGKPMLSGKQPGPSDTVTFNTAGTYYWAAFYTGDGNNNAAASDCTKEVVTVTKAKPSITTKLSKSEIKAGWQVYDSATLTGTSGSNAGGQVTYQYYRDLRTCTSDTASWTGSGGLHGTSAGTFTVTGGVVPDSNTVRFLFPGTYYWAAFYSGDANNAPAASGCATEKLEVEKVPPSPLPPLPRKPQIITHLSKISILTGWRVHDDARLVDALGKPHGKLKYRFYSTLRACLADTAVWPLKQPQFGHDAGEVTVIDVDAPPSRNIRFNKPGTYYWAAFWAGDNYNWATASDCRTEVLKVRPRPHLITHLSKKRIVAGGQVRDGARLVGAASGAGGTVAYRYYSTLRACQADTSGWPQQSPRFGHSAGMGTVTGGVAAPSQNIRFGQSGTYYWAAFYSGDGSNPAVASKCLTEVLTVKKHEHHRD